MGAGIEVVVLIVRVVVVVGGFGWWVRDEVV